MVATLTRAMLVLTVTGVMGISLGGCSSEAQSGTARDLAQAPSYHTPSNSLAASDGLGAIVFGDPSVRNQVAMLRHGTEAFARAEAEAIDDIPTQANEAYATVDPASEE
jgi:hypothetical protein